MQTMNPQELGPALQRICSQLNDYEGNALKQFFADTRSRIVGCIARPLDQLAPGQEEQALSWGRIGGYPLVPEGFAWPKDRFERNMLFIAQFDLARMPRAGDNYPASGLLTIFRSLQAAKLNAKDRRAFAVCYFNDPSIPLTTMSHPNRLDLPVYAFDSGVTWTVGEDLSPLLGQISLSPEVEAQAYNWAYAFNQLAHCQAQLFGNNVVDLELAKHLCAFAANGVSFSFKRAADSNYSHLLAQSPEWVVLARIRENELFGTESGADESVIMIRKDDLATGQLEKAWSISRGPYFIVES